MGENDRICVMYTGGVMYKKERPAIPAERSRL